MVNNVIRSGSAIKGTGSGCPQIIAPGRCSPAERGAQALVLLEKLFGGGTVGLGALHVRLDAGDLGLQSFDPLVQLVDGHRIEVLPGESDERVVGLARE